MDLKGKMISLVVPLYNEQEVLTMSFERMSAVMKKLGCRYEIIYTDDGSADNTWAILQEIVRRNPCVKGLRFSRNFGHQPAVTAGMDAAQGDAVIIIDADLQDPPEVIPELIQKWLEGYEVVYGKRKKREGEKAGKKITAFFYYRLLRSMSAYPIPLDTGDFRLIDRKVCDTLCSMREHNRFLRGMAAWAGFKQCPLEYVRHERAAGKTNYTLKKMLKLAMDGVLGFSQKPLMLPLYLGAAVALISFIGAILLGVLGGGMTNVLLALVLMMSGVVLMMMGIQGAYFSRMNDEVLARPLYIVSEKIQSSQRPRQPEKKTVPAERKTGENQHKQGNGSRKERPSEGKAPQSSRPERRREGQNIPAGKAEQQIEGAVPFSQILQQSQPGRRKQPSRQQNVHRNEEKRPEKKRQENIKIEYPAMEKIEIAEGALEQRDEKTAKWLAERAARRSPQR